MVFRVMDVTKPFAFMVFGAMDVTRPCEFIGFGAMDVTKPDELIGFGAMDVTNTHEFILFLQGGLLFMRGVLFHCSINFFRFLVFLLQAASGRFPGGPGKTNGWLSGAVQGPSDPPGPRPKNRKTHNHNSVLI